MSSSNLSVNANVTIRYLDENRKVIKVQRIHNKANIQLVEGLLRFLQGDFTPSPYNESQYDNSDAPDYIPSELRFGTVGVKMRDRSTDKPRLTSIEESEIKTPTFDDFGLQEEIKMLNPLYIAKFDKERIKFESTELASFDDPNNSLALLLQTFIPAGHLVRMKNDDPVNPYIYYIDSNVQTTEEPIVGKGWAYWNPSAGPVDSQGEHVGEYEALFTEMGLFSGTGRLLARVVFDGIVEINQETGEITFEDESYERNPLIQSESSSIVVEWRIGIVSIGSNDEVITVANVNPIETEDDENNGN